MSEQPVIIYTDGGSDPNPGIGGWAAILLYGEHEKVLMGNDPEATNNRMELMAAISALSALKRPSNVVLHTDSRYVQKGITEWIEGWASKGWRSGGKEIANIDLWQKLWPLTKKHTIDWQWVKGHAGNPLNERVDQLARKARLAITPETIIDENAPRVYLKSSCKGNPGPGGWGVVVEFPEYEEMNSGSEPQTTNNRMELQAVIEGLLLAGSDQVVQVFTTSDYVFQGATQWIKGWRKRQWQKKDGTAVANHDLWQALDQMMKLYQIKWVNAKGQEIPALEKATQLAKEAVQLEMGDK